MSDTTLDDAVSFAREQLDRLIAENPELSQDQICQLFSEDDVVKSRPDVTQSLATAQMVRIAERHLEVMEMIAVFERAGRDLDPEMIAIEVVKKHRDGLDGVPDDDRDFLLFYAHRGVEEEAEAILGAEEAAT